MGQSQHLGAFIYHYANVNDSGGETEYAVRFDSDTALHWECITGEEKGRSAHETVTRVVIRPDVHFLSWTEADGLVATQVVDFSAMTVHAVLVIGKERMSLNGTVERV